MKKKLILGILVIVLIACASTDMLAQCPMCRMSAESNLQDGGTEARGLNNGILYMLAMPYMLVGILGFLWWKNRKDDDEDAIPLTYSDN